MLDRHVDGSEAISMHERWRESGDAPVRAHPRLPTPSEQCGYAQVKTSQSSAEWRAGLAGRAGPGHCYRLWSSEGHNLREFATQPAVLFHDPLPVIIESILWHGLARLDGPQLPLIDELPEGAWQAGVNVLMKFGVLARDGESGMRIVDAGRLHRMAALPVDPRLAHMMLMCAPHPWIYVSHVDLR